MYPPSSKIWKQNIYPDHESSEQNASTIEKKIIAIIFKTTLPTSG